MTETRLEENTFYDGSVTLVDAVGITAATMDEAALFIEKRDVIVEYLANRWEKSIRGPLKTKFALELPELHVATFGDSIILSRQSTSTENIIASLGIHIRPIVPAALLNGIRFRGATGVGKFIRQENTILGPAVNDVARWYEETDWFGVIATPKTGLKISESCEYFGNEEEFAKFFVQYDVPLKNGKRQRMWVSAWPMDLLELQGNDLPARKVLLECLGGFEIPRGTESKYYNTLDFFDWYVEKFGSSLANDAKDLVEPERQQEAG